MADILYPPSRPQSVGEILDSAFRLFRSTLGKCLGYAALALLAGQLPNLYSIATGRPLFTPGQTLSNPGLLSVLYIVGSIFSVVFSSAILLRQYRIATGLAPDAGVELRTSLRRIPAILLLSILFVLAIGVCFVPLALVRGTSTLVVMFLVLLIPASIVLLALSSAYTLLLVAGESAVGSMVHSARLTWGNWGRLTLIYTVAVVLIFAFYMVFGILAGVLSVLLGHADIVVMTAATAVVVLVLGSIITPFYTALSISVLGDLLVRKEGTDLAERISAAANR